MFTFTVHTEIEINAPAERVWQVLTDLAAYQNWNPMIRRATGEINEGSRLTLYFHPSGTKGRIFHPLLLVAEPNRELRWKGKPGFPLFLESEHVFIIQPIGKRAIRLVHDMTFSGLLIPFIKKTAVKLTFDPFVAMNHALKGRAEQYKLRGEGQS